MASSLWYFVMSVLGNKYKVPYSGVVCKERSTEAAVVMCPMWYGQDGILQEKTLGLRTMEEE